VSEVKTTIKAKNGVVVVHRMQDVEPYLKANEAEFNEAPTWRPYAKSKGRNLRKVADIPNIVVEQWMKEGVNIFSNDPDMQKKVRKKLDDYTNRRLRTYPGRLGSRARMM
jgi:hypothetical protein